MDRQRRLFLTEEEKQARRAALFCAGIIVAFLVAGIFIGLFGIPRI